IGQTPTKQKQVGRRGSYCSADRPRKDQIMKSLLRNQMVAVSLTIMAIALVVECGDAAPNSPPGPDVRVVNTETNPVPVIQVGTTTVNLSSSNNTVIVANPTNNPVLVRQVDSSAAQPVQLLGDVRMDIGA